jgi:hypothetical protein
VIQLARIVAPQSCALARRTRASSGARSERTSLRAEIGLPQGEYGPA